MTEVVEETRPVTFESLNLVEPLQRALKDEKYVVPTPIQAQAIPHLLEGRDLLGRAQTGSGKTAAFALPMLQKLSEKKGRPPRGFVRALILTPTRELAVQVEESFRTYGRHMKLSVAVVYGGVSQVPQVKALQRGVDVLVATPGRLLDLVNQGHAKLKAVEVFVLDEADRMLDMGFIPDIRRIVAMVPSKRQTLFFSATMPMTAMQLANDMLTNPLVVNVAPERKTADNIEQKVFFVERENKRQLLTKMLAAPEITRALVFTRTKHKADNVARQLRNAKIQAEAIHGDRSQSSRQNALDSFRSGRTRVLVATDVASRGIDVDSISHVFNFEMPQEAEVYVHRIGRTARAGAAGVAYSFCGTEERAQLGDIEKLIQRSIDVMEEHPFRSTVPYIPPSEKAAPFKMRGGRGPRVRSGRMPRHHV